MEMKLTVAERNYLQENIEQAKTVLVILAVGLAIIVAMGMFLWLMSSSDGWTAIVAILNGFVAAGFLLGMGICGCEIYRCRKILRRGRL